MAVPVRPIDWTGTFFAALTLGLVGCFLLHYFGIKLVSDESSPYAEFNELKFIKFKQTFIITKVAN